MAGRVLYRAALLVDDSTTAKGRTLDIRAVPFDHEVRLSATEAESFDPHAFDAQLATQPRVPFTIGHPPSANGSVNAPGVDLPRMLIGRVTSMRATGDGLRATVRMGTSSAARDALALIVDETLSEVSVGFVPQDTVTVQRAGGVKLLRRVRARLDHVAVVVAGAYGPQATVLAVRSAPAPAVSCDREFREIAARHRRAAARRGR